MPKDIYEGEPIFPRVWLHEGEATNASVVFKYIKNDDLTQWLARHNFGLPAGDAREGLVDEYTPPDVGKAEESYLLTVLIFVNDREIDTKEDNQYRVWPKWAIVEAVDEDDRPLPSGKASIFRFHVWQSNPSNKRRRRNDQKFDLEKGKGFEIEVLPPFEPIGEIPKVGRKRRVRVREPFEVEILAPAERADKKQFVNLSSKDGDNGASGSRVRVVLGVKGDRSKPEADQRAQPDLTCHVEVRFSAADGAVALSKRNTPLRALVKVRRSKGMAQFKEIRKGVCYTAVVCFGSKLDGRNVAIFEIELGLAGGDMCELNVGPTPDCRGPQRTFVNWRRIYYELCAADFMKPQRFSDEVVAGLEEVGKKIFVEYTYDGTVVLSRAAASKLNLHVLPRKHIGEEGEGDALVVRSGFEMPPYELKHKPNQVCFVLADYVAIPASGASKHVFKTVTEADVQIWLGDGFALSPDKLKVTWTATVGKAALTFEDRVRPQKTYLDTTRIITVSGPRLTEQIYYAKSEGGNIPVEMTPEWEELVSGWMKEWCSEAGKNVHLKLAHHGATDDDRARLAAAKAKLQELFDAIVAEAKPARHPAVDEQGRPRTGELSADELDLSKSTYGTLIFKLPTTTSQAPGALVGPLSEQRCPINLRVEYKEIKKAAGYIKPNSLEGAIWIHQPHCHLIKVVSHEIGHKMAMTLMKPFEGETAPGLDKPSTVLETNTAYPKNGKRGHIYNGNNHPGPHCAYGLSDQEKGSASYTDGFGGKALCIMFGETITRDEPPSFCPECVEHIRARDLRDLTTAF